MAAQYSSPPTGPQPMVYQTPDHITAHPNGSGNMAMSHIEPINVDLEKGHYQPGPPQQAQQHQQNYHPSIIEDGPRPTSITPLRQLSESPAMIACPFCRYRVQTRVQKEDTNMTTICGVLLCLICICAACLPCLLHWFNDYHHYCTHCGKKVATRKDDGTVHVYEPQDEDNQTWYPDAPPPVSTGPQKPPAAQVKG